MSLCIEPTRFAEGIWRALLSQSSDLKAPPPKIDVLLRGRPVRGVRVDALDMENCYELSVPIPPEAVGFGTYMLLIVEQGSSKVLSRIVLSGGDLNGEDLRAEMAELRAEIDLLKRHFAHHAKVTFKPFTLRIA